MLIQVTSSQIAKEMSLETPHIHSQRTFDGYNFTVEGPPYLLH